MTSQSNFRISQKLAFILFVLLFSSLLSSSTLADDLKLIKERSLNVKSGETLYIEASGADIKVNSWDKEEAYVKIYGNRKAEDKMKFTIKKVSSGVKVIAKKESSWFFNWGGGYSVRIEVMVPKNFNTDLETSGGDIKVQNLSGKFLLETSGGDVVLKNTNGEIKLETSGGDIYLENHKGKSQVSTSGGDIITKTFVGDLRASTSGGDVKVEVSNGSLSARTSGGDISISYDGQNKGIKASTSGGDIELKLPSSFAANVELETTGGSIDNNFKNSSTKKVKRGLLIAEFNGGGEKVDCSTSGGNIDVYEK